MLLVHVLQSDPTLKQPDISGKYIVYTAFKPINLFEGHLACFKVSAFTIRGFELAPTAKPNSLWQGRRLRTCAIVGGHVYLSGYMDTSINDAHINWAGPGNVQNHRITFKRLVQPFTVFLLSSQEYTFATIWLS